MLAELHGKPSHGRVISKTEPKPVGNLSDAPDYFTDDQKAAWAYALAHSPPGLLKLIDRGMLVAFIVAEDLHRQAVIEQSKVRLIWRPPGSTQPQQSPYLPIINRQALIMSKAASELGFSPVSRPRVGAKLTPGQGMNDGTPASAKQSGARREPAALRDYLANAPKRPSVH